MTELDELKDAMALTPGFEPAPLDLNHILAAGGRVRRRRRVAVGAASGVAVIAVVIGGGQLMSGAATNRSPVAGSPASQYGVPQSGSSGQPSYPAPSGVMPSTHGGPGILGAVVETGEKLDGKRWIIYVETMDPDKLEENITLVLGRPTTGYINDFTRDIVSSDPGSGRMSQGFHAVTAGTIKDGQTTPTFGYYAGDAARITARDMTGMTVEAHLTAWQGFGRQERAQIFWFDFAQGTAPAKLTGFTAYDKDGKTLPAGWVFGGESPAVGTVRG
jgi:hypothetical protein